MAADAQRFAAAFVIAVRGEQALVEMAERGLRQRLDHDGLEIRRHGLRQHAAARLDHAGDGERVPQRFAEAVAEEEFLLLHRGVGAALQEAQRCVDHREAASRQLRLPGLHRRPAVAGARRDISSRGVEAAMQAIAGLDLRPRIVVIGHDLVAGVAELDHGTPP